MTHTGNLIIQQKGFTLVEMAMVLLIVALLLGGMLVPLSAQMEQRNVSETQKALSEIKEAIIGYAIVNGRLPCPASSTSNGVENPMGGGNCSNFNNGFVPAATLGLTPVDNQGYAIDAWNNRILYAVTSWSSTTPPVNYVFTTASGMSAVGISNLSPNLLVCSTATGISGSSCASGAALTSSPGVPVVIFSTGKNGAYGGTGTDEAANLDGNNTFVSHTPAPRSSANGEFDDIVVWISPNVLLNRMVAAGKLP
jgi:prepilin-type N-terminal cleavage/methylation domain-containing protein